MTKIHYRPFLAQFFLECAMFQTGVLDKIKHAQFTFSNFLFEIRVLCEMIWKNLLEPEDDRRHYGVLDT